MARTDVDGDPALRGVPRITRPDAVGRRPRDRTRRGNTERPAGPSCRTPLCRHVLIIGFEPPVRIFWHLILAEIVDTNE